MKLEIKYRETIWYDPVNDEQGMNIRTQFFRIRYDSYKDIHQDIKDEETVLVMPRSEITIPSVSHIHPFSEYYKTTKDEDYLHACRAFLLGQCEIEIKHHLKTELLIRDIKPDVIVIILKPDKEGEVGTA